MEALVVGFGSIGSRHARLLQEMGHAVSVVSRRKVEFPSTFATISEALAKKSFSYAVIANETSQHQAALRELAEAKFQGTVLVEKPLFDKYESLPKNEFKDVFVAYNLRFHPVLLALHKALQGQKILTAQVYVGQYLPNWRKGQQDYRKNYSAKKAEGGGVLRDLSHELDYMAWLFGPWKKIAAIGGHLSSLEIDSDDAWGILMATERSPLITMQLNYLDRATRRAVVVNTEEHSYKADLVRNTFQVDDHVEKFEIDRDFTYKKQHQAVFEGKANELCSWTSGLGVLKTIEAVEWSAQSGKWA